MAILNQGFRDFSNNGSISHSRGDGSLFQNAYIDKQNRYNQAAQNENAVIQNTLAEAPVKLGLLQQAGHVAQQNADTNYISALTKYNESPFTQTNRLGSNTFGLGNYNNFMPRLGSLYSRFNQPYGNQYGYSYNNLFSK